MVQLVFQFAVVARVVGGVKRGRCVFRVDVVILASWTGKTRLGTVSGFITISR